jgi:hypothetical protein
MDAQSAAGHRTALPSPPATVAESDDGVLFGGRRQNFFVRMKMNGTFGSLAD